MYAQTSHGFLTQARRDDRGAGGDGERARRHRVAAEDDAGNQMKNIS